MTTPRDFGRAVPEQVHFAAELSFDMFEGQTVPPTLGRATIPVNALPEMTFDMATQESGPLLELTLQFRAEATPLEVARDLHRLYAQVNELEMSGGGSGLFPIETASRVVPTNGRLRVAFRPANPNEARQRLEGIVDRVKTAAYEGNLESCEVRVLSAAA